MEHLRKCKRCVEPYHVLFWCVMVGVGGEGVVAVQALAPVDTSALCDLAGWVAGLLRFSCV